MTPAARPLLPLLAALAVLVAAPSASAELVSVKDAANGAKRMIYRVGPFDIKPGQNEISNQLITDRPQFDGYITRMRPDLVYLNGKVPGVDVIHLHHGVWINWSQQNPTSALPELFVAAGEEKTIVRFPKGYGYVQARATTGS